MYTQQELELLLDGFRKSMPISELESLLGRSAYGIVQKMQALSNVNPKTWNPERVVEYHRQYYQQHKDEKRGYYRQYYQQHKDEASSYFKKWYKKNKGKWEKSAVLLRFKIEENYSGTLMELALRLGIHICSLGNYLQGNRKPEDDILKKISKTLKVPYSELKGLYA